MFIDNPLVPDKFRNNPNYPAFLQAAEKYVNLPWDEVSNPSVAANIAALGAFFAWEFGRNADYALNHLTQEQAERPSRDASDYRAMLSLALTETATSNINGPGYGVCAHIYPALDAAEQAGSNIAPLCKLVEGTDRADYFNLPSSIRSFVQFSDLYLDDKNKCLGILGLARELLLDQVFEKVTAHLPQTPKFAAYRNFLDKHISLDQNDHGPKMARILDNCVSNVDDAVMAATNFLNQRTALYRHVLNLDKPFINIRSGAAR